MDHQADDLRVETVLGLLAVLSGPDCITSERADLGRWTDCLSSMFWEPGEGRSCGCSELRRSLAPCLLHQGHRGRGLTAADLCYPCYSGRSHFNGVATKDGEPGPSLFLLVLKFA